MDGQHYLHCRDIGSNFVCQYWSIQQVMTQISALSCQKKKTMMARHMNNNKTSKISFINHVQEVKVGQPTNVKHRSLEAAIPETPVNHAKRKILISKNVKKLTYVLSKICSQWFFTLYSCIQKQDQKLYRFCH